MFRRTSEWEIVRWKIIYTLRASLPASPIVYKNTLKKKKSKHFNTPLTNLAAYLFTYLCSRCGLQWWCEENLISISIFFFLYGHWCRFARLENVNNKLWCNFIKNSSLKTLNISFFLSRAHARKSFLTIS